ncbi:hypothetical protein B7463_g9384, partial [Scytalidium lignicola]
MASIQIFQLDPTQDLWLLPALVDLHIASIEHDNSLMRFHPPFTPEKRAKMLSFWRERMDQARSKRCIIIVATMTKTSTITPIDGQEHEKEVEKELCGVIELGTPDADTGPFRGAVEMLMVSPAHRRLGLATKLMLKLEEIALQEGRTLLHLSTTVGSPAAEYLYPRLGYVKVGVVPNYGIVPNTGELVDGVYFYKDLRLRDDKHVAS